MNRIIRIAQRSMTAINKSNFSITVAKLPPSGSVPQPPQKIMHKFIPHVYGLQLDAHILPNANFSKKVILTQDQYQFYQKVSPNYLVAIIKKVIDESAAPPQIQTISPLDQFYRVSTYCHVKYMQNNSIQIQGVYRVKIEDIKKISMEKIQNKNTQTTIKPDQPTSTDQAQSNVIQIIDQQSDQIDQELKIQKQANSTKQNLSIQNLLKKTYPSRQHHSKRQFYYSLKVKKIQEPPLQITPTLQFKFKYLMDCYMKMYKTIHIRSLPVTFNIKDLNIILDQIAIQCSLISSKKQQVQRYLESSDPEQKIDILLKLLQKNTHITNYFNQIENEAKNIVRNKKFYEFYSEMMKVAKQIIDGKKTKQLFLQKCSKNFHAMNPPKNVIQVFNTQVQKYEHLDENSMQAGIIKNYIEQLSKIPYSVRSQQIFDLEFAQKVMNEQHYGMKDVKDAILQVIAVGKLKKSLKGKIFCFIGGPGLGKTSFAKSVARALNRKFYNISLGGVSDSSVLKGHRRTYIGAYSGKIIQALKNCGTSNPVILLDQIDKMGSSYHGDPRSELLQILDPNQNNSFVDNYVDIPVDLSNVLFITSANYQRNISKPLLDRMQRIYLTSYTKNQKIQIFNRHLLRRAIDKTGVLPEQFSLPPQVIEALVEQYSLGQPGVRYLQKHALSLLQKVAYKMLVKQEEVPIKITKQNLSSYLGNNYFRRKDHQKIGTGVAISLGGGDYGSRLTYIQAFKKSYITRKQINRGTLFTGSLGNVFKEAMNISYTYARNFLLQNFKNRYLYTNQVHVHAPEGAFKKDGSTDSMTIVAALVSLALQIKVKSGVAMTGEITLNGHVLRTHSIKEKVMVARRERINQIILPKDNQPDVQNLTPDIKQGITFHFVSNFSQAYSYLFPERAQAEAKNKAQKQQPVIIQSRNQTQNLSQNKTIV